jgi:hypothetical protein
MALSTPLLNNTEVLSRFMPGPMGWFEIKSGLGGSGELCELAFVKLLGEAPIALYRAGAALTKIRLTYVPIYGNFSMLCPQGRTSWDDLGAACANLAVFECRNIYRERYLVDPLLGEDKSYIDNYVGAILSRCGEHLRVLDLYFSH